MVGKRLCVDFRALNKITRTYVWPMPRVEDIFAELGKAKFYTTPDLRSGYHQIALDKDSITKTAFVSPLGKYEYLKVPFGLAQAPAYFQNLMNKVLNGLNFTLAYLDDVIIFSETAEQHLKHIQIVLTRLKQANLKLKKSLAFDCSGNLSDSCVTSCPIPLSGCGSGLGSSLWTPLCSEFPGVANALC